MNEIMIILPNKINISVNRMVQPYLHHSKSMNSIQLLTISSAHLLWHMANTVIFDINYRHSARKTVVFSVSMRASVVKFH